MQKLYVQLVNFLNMLSTGDLVLGFIAVLAIVILFMYIQTNRKLRHGRKLLLNQLEAQEQHFQNIHNQIYDNIAQVLSLAKWNLQSVELGLPTETNQKISHANELISKAIIDLRHLSKDQVSAHGDKMRAKKPPA
jgi:signal transduction histidine kinase